MQLLFNKLEHKQVLETEIWVSKCGSSVFKRKDETIIELKVRTAIETNSKDKYKYPAVTHGVPKLPNKIARLVLLVWPPTLPEDFSKLRTGYRDGNYMHVDYDNLFWDGTYLEPRYPVKQVGDYNLYISKNGEIVCKKHGNYYLELKIHTRALGRVVYHDLKGLTVIVPYLQLMAWYANVENITEYPITFVDGNKLNTEFTNLTIPTFFKEPKVEVKQVLDTSVYISRNGEEAYWKYADNNWRKLSNKKDKDGYIELYHGIEGLTRKRHRLVALAWLEVPDGYKDLHINHLNNLPGSDDYTNLEWCTYLENQDYSRKQGRSGKGYAYIKLRTSGEIIRYDSLNALSLTCIKSRTEWYLRTNLNKVTLLELDEGWVSRDKELLEKL